MPFRRVEGEKAGPTAVGILVPPGRRTLIIVRPRALDWDLIPVSPELPLVNGPGLNLWEVAGGAAAALAQRVAEALEKWARGGEGRVEAVGAPDGDGYHVRAAVGVFVLLVCRRQPGQPYQPMVFSSVDAAQEAARRLADFLCPPENAEQELYFNSRHFAR